MFVVGIDYSTHAVDLVRVPYDTNAQPVWQRFLLTGQDAFDRTRTVAEAFTGHGRNSTAWDDVLAVGIEDPRGQNAGALYRVQGAILAQIPAEKLVEKWVPSAWRKANRLPGNCDKAVIWRASLSINGNLDDWPQDAHDAHLIALATIQSIETKEAA